MIINISTKERFWSRVKKGGPNDCWEWQGCLRGKTGYGVMRYGGKPTNTHRISYLLNRGEIPRGILVCHSCDNRKCVNPNHLFLGTYQDNYDDAVVKGRIVQQSKWDMKDLKHPSSQAYDRGCRCNACKARKAYKNAKRRTLKKSIKIELFSLG